MKSTSPLLLPFLSVFGCAQIALQGQSQAGTRGKF